MLEEAKSNSQDPEALKFLNARIQACDALGNYRAGKWAELPFDEYFANWIPKSGIWTFPSEGKIEGFRMDVAEASSHLFSLLQFEPPYQLEVEVEFKNSDPGAKILVINEIVILKE